MTYKTCRVCGTQYTGFFCPECGFDNCINKIQWKVDHYSIQL